MLKNTCTEQIGGMQAIKHLKLFEYVRVMYLK
jgi:hypothetical protein